MKHLFPFVALAFVMLACPVLASGDGPDPQLIGEASKENSWEQLRLGMWHESQHHYEEAAMWFHKGAIQGNAAAQYHLGMLCENGQGLSQDYPEAAKWYRAAAEHGNIPARERLGVLSENGQGMLKDYTQAYMWFYLAAAQRDRVAAKHTQALEKTLPSAQIAEGQRLAHGWMQQHPEPRVDY